MTDKQREENLEARQAIEDVIAKIKFYTEMFGELSGDGGPTFSGSAMFGLFLQFQAIENDLGKALEILHEGAA